MPLPSISEDTIRHQSNPQSFSWGEDYYRRQAVAELVQRGQTIQAQVEGSDVEPYRVTLQCDAAGITKAWCTCPYSFEGWCKHLVATALTWVRQPERLEVRPTLEQLLDRLNLVQTQGLVQTLVNEHPDLIEIVEQEVMLIAQPAPTPQAPTVRRSAVDVAPFRRQVKRILREGLQSMEEGYEDDPITDELQGVIDKALAFAHQGDGQSAIAILEGITSTCADEWDELADMGGDSFPIAEALEDAWTETILSAEIPPSQVTQLQEMLEEWQDSMNADFSGSLAALVQGWQDPQIQRALQGQGFSDAAALEAPEFEQLAWTRLRILDHQGREEEYLNWAKTAGLMQPYLTRLAQLGRIEEAMSTAQSRMTTADEAFALAQTLREHSHLPEALAIAQAGLPLPGKARYDLAQWTSDLAMGLDRPELALEACQIAFSLRPSFNTYQRMERLAGSAWSTLQPQLLQSLRQSQNWGIQEDKVDIFLHEGLIDDAIAVVKGDTYYGSRLVQRVMQAAIAQRPKWVIEAARQRAEPIMNQKKADRYADAVDWLKQAKAAYLHSGQQAAWKTYFEGLVSIHARKPKLMKLFQSLR